MKCALCGKSSTRVLRDTVRGGVKRKVFRCTSCSLTFLEPKKTDLHAYYGTEYRATYTPLIGKVSNSAETHKIYLPFQKERIARLKPILRKNMRVLDIGASSGHFLQALKPYVKERIALEYNQSDAEFMRKKLGLKVYTTPIEETDLPKGYFDLITVIQTFEHIDGPIHFLQSLIPYLKPGGKVYIEVPNINEALLSVYHIEPYAGFSFKEAHVFYYSPKTFAAMLKKGGFGGSIKSIQRMNFLNHVHWLYTGKPQAGPHIHMAPAKLVEHEKTPLDKKINAWVHKIDQQYRDLLNTNGAGESLAFIGRPLKAKK